MIKKLLQKNIQLSYALIGMLNLNNDFKQDGLYLSALKRFLQSFAQELRGKNVLDVGSGSWEWTKETFSSICEVTTFDIVPHKNIDVVGDLYHLHESFAGEPRIDAVIATDVFEHLTRPSEALQQITAVLKPGGFLLGSTPFKKNLHGEDYGDYWRITRQGWQHLLKQAGFVNISISWLGEELFPVAYFMHATKNNTTV